MRDFSEGERTPWSGRAISKVVIHEGVETIGARAFEGCGDLREVSLPSTLVSVGKDAFRGCPVRTDSDGRPYGVTTGSEPQAA